MACVCSLLVVWWLGLLHHTLYAASVFPSRTSADNVSHVHVNYSNITSCDAVKPIFQMKNVSSHVPDKPINGSSLQVCTAPLSCCSLQMEESLLQLVRHDFQGLLHHHSRSLEGLLASTASRIEEHAREVTRISQERTLTLLSQVYPRQRSDVSEPVHQLHRDMVRYLSRDRTNPIGTIEVSLEDSVHTFFSHIFPLIFPGAAVTDNNHHNNNNHHNGSRVIGSSRRLSEDYSSCLSATMGEISPFGDIPQRLGVTLDKSFESTRVLLQALTLGVHVLASTDDLVLSEECHLALTHMTYCARCRGLTHWVKPCAGYCLNVVRGCLTQHAADLDLPWNGFVEATQRLAALLGGGSGGGGGHVGAAVGVLYTGITEATMHVVENGLAVQRRAKRACGQPRYAIDTSSAEMSVEDDSSSSSNAANQSTVVVSVTDGGGGGGDVPGDSLLTSQLQLLLSSLGRSRGFYANLAESLCSDDSFAETRDTAECWNGQRVGEYTKMVVSSSVSAQKYNPELVWSPRGPEPRIARLSDTLRHIRQVVLSQLTMSPESDSYIRALEGSGSGHEPGTSRWGDDEDQDEDHDESWADQGSGSGEQPGEPGLVVPGVRGDIAGIPKETEVETERATAAARGLPSSLLVAAALIVALRPPAAAALVAGRAA